METSILNEFIALEEANSFSKAAKNLGMSQASLSRHIKQLEDEYGVTLFERTTQKIKLTPYGQSLLVHARAILESEREFKREAERISFKTANHLIIGSVDFPFYYGITEILANFKKENPTSTLDVRIESTDKLVSLLKTGQIDVAFIRKLENSLNGFESVFYKEDRMYLVAPASHGGEPDSLVSLSDFKNEIFYKRYRKNSYMEKLFNKMIDDAGFTPIISSSEAGWEDSVINDLNTVTTCTGGLAESFRGNVHVKVFNIAPEYRADIYLAKSLSKNPSELAEKFMNFVRPSKSALEAGR